MVGCHLHCRTSVFLLGTVAATGPSVSGPIQQQQPLFIQKRHENPSAPAAYNMYSGTQIFSRTSQQSLEQDTVAGKRTVQLGNFPQQSVPLSGKQENGTYFVVQGVGAGKSSIAEQQPSFQVVQQPISSAAPAQYVNLQVSGVASQQSVEQVPVVTTWPVQQQVELTDATALLGSSSKQNLPTSVPQGKEKKRLLVTVLYLSEINFKEC